MYAVTVVEMRLGFITVQVQLCGDVPVLNLDTATATPVLVVASQPPPVTRWKALGQLTEIVIVEVEAVPEAVLVPQFILTLPVDDASANDEAVDAPLDDTAAAEIRPLDVIPAVLSDEVVRLGTVTAPVLLIPDPPAKNCAAVICPEAVIAPPTLIPLLVSGRVDVKPTVDSTASDCTLPPVSTPCTLNPLAPNCPLTAVREKEVRAPELLREALVIAPLLENEAADTAPGTEILAAVSAPEAVIGPATVTLLAVMPAVTVIGALNDSDVAVSGPAEDKLLPVMAPLALRLPPTVRLDTVTAAAVKPPVKRTLVADNGPADSEGAVSAPPEIDKSPVMVAEAELCKPAAVRAPATLAVAAVRPPEADRLAPVIAPLADNVDPVMAPDKEMLAAVMPLLSDRLEAVSALVMVALLAVRLPATVRPLAPTVNEVDVKDPAVTDVTLI